MYDAPSRNSVRTRLLARLKPRVNAGARDLPVGELPPKIVEQALAHERARRAADRAARGCL